MGLGTTPWVWLEESHVSIVISDFPKPSVSSPGKIILNSILGVYPMQQLQGHWEMWNENGPVNPEKGCLGNLASCGQSVDKLGLGKHQLLWSIYIPSQETMEPDTTLIRYKEKITHNILFLTPMQASRHIHPVTPKSVNVKRVLRSVVVSKKTAMME